MRVRNSTSDSSRSGQSNTWAIFSSRNGTGIRDWTVRTFSRIDSATPSAVGLRAARAAPARRALSPRRGGGGGGRGGSRVGEAREGHKVGGRPPGCRGGGLAEGIFFVFFFFFFASPGPRPNPAPATSRFL